jgi:hypothetical protein
MVVLSRLGIALNVGLFAVAAGAMIAACGSITVIDPDGGPGSGGSIAGGAGGAQGGATGGSTGGKGGSGVTDGGALGGHNGGGSGGIIGGLGGLFGGSGGRNAGLGGTTGGGGFTGGTGGRTGSLGGTTGSGGFSGGGLGGTTGAGGRTGTQTCTDIQRNFATALAEAKICAGASQCQFLTNDQVECGCPTSVVSTVKVDSYRQSWNQSGCSSGFCPAILCPYVSGGFCSVSTSGSSTCIDTSAGPP